MSKKILKPPPFPWKPQLLPLDYIRWYMQTWKLEVYDCMNYNDCEPKAGEMWFDKPYLYRTGLIKGWIKFNGDPKRYSINGYYNPKSNYLGFNVEVKIISENKKRYMWFNGTPVAPKVSNLVEGVYGKQIHEKNSKGNWISGIVKQGVWRCDTNN